MPKNDERKSVRCSFCGKHQEQVARIIAGPGAYICNVKGNPDGSSPHQEPQQAAVVL